MTDTPPPSPRSDSGTPRRSGRSGRAPLPRATRVAMWTGGALFWVVQSMLFLAGDVPLLDSVLLSLLLVLLPAFSLAQLPLVEDAWVERLPAYWGSIAALWLIGTACWFVGTRFGGREAVGLVWMPIVALLGWTVLLTVSGLGIIVAFRAISMRLGWRESSLLRQLLPRTREESAVFAVLSVAAGAGEEVAYRGYAIPMLAPLLGVSGSVVATSIVFGILHGYQGALGIVRTALMGAVLAVGFLASGSLLPSILAHTAIDLVAGIVLGERLLPPRAPTGVGDGDRHTGT